MTSTSTLPRRAGPGPRTSPWAPHVQQDQLAPPAMADALAPANRVMLYGPRDEQEVEVLFGLIAAAVRRAGGRAPAEPAQRADDDYRRHVRPTPAVSRGAPVDEGTT